MKVFNLIQKTSFLIIIIIIIFLSIFNQRQYTRLKILIWNTPSLTLGNYLAISCGTGFILSYLVTTNINNSKKTNFKKEIRYKFNENNEENNLTHDNDLNIETNNETNYDTNLIERDIKDPSPTINASFRIISNNNRKISSPKEKQYNSSYYSEESDNQYYEQKINYNDKVKLKAKSDDWEDDSYTNW